MHKIKLTSENVHDTFIKCLFKPDEPTDNAIITEGIMMKVGFHPGRLEANKENISAMLSELPKEFQKDGGGGGYSFLNACQDKDGNQWADLHKTTEELVVLGIACGKVRFLFERDMWSAFPGGVPYFVVNL